MECRHNAAAGAAEVVELIPVGGEAVALMLSSKGVAEAVEKGEVIEVVGVEVEVVVMGGQIKKMVNPKRSLRMNAELTLAPKSLPLRRTNNIWMRISQTKKNSLSFMSS